MKTVISILKARLKRLSAILIAGQPIPAWVAMSSLFLFFAARHLLDSDEGVTLNGAWQIYSGGRLYADLFEYVTPGSFYIVLFFWKIFGINYWSAKLSGLLAILIAVGGIRKISSFFLGDKLLAALPASLFALSALSWSFVNHNTYSIAAIVWSIYFFLKSRDSGPKINALLSGLLVACAIMILQQKGLVLMAALVSFSAYQAFIRKKAGPAEPFILLAASLAPLSLLLIFWQPALLKEALIDFPLQNYIEENMVNFSMLALCLLMQPAFFIILKRAKEKIEPLIWIQLFLLIQTIPRADSFHLLLVLFPSYILTAMVIARLKECRSFGKIIIGGWLFALFCLILIPGALSFARFPPSATIRGSKALQAIQNECSSTPTIYAGPFMPGIYFEAGKINPIPYSQMHLLTKEQLDESAEKLSRARPACAVLNYAITEKFNYRKNSIDQFIRDNYSLIYKEGEFELHKINASP